MVLPQEQIACFYCSLNCHINFGKKLSYTWNLWMDVSLCVNSSKADVRQIPYLYCQMEERHWLNNVPSCFLSSCQLVAHRTLAIKKFHSLILHFRRNPLLFLVLKLPFIISFVSFSDRYHSSDFKHTLPAICFPAWHPVEEPPPLKFVTFLLAILCNFSDSTISLLRRVGAEPKGIQDVIAPLIHTSVMTSSVSFTVPFWNFPVFPLAVLTAAEGWADILTDLSVINNLKSSFLSGNSQLRAPKTPDMEKVGCHSEFSYFCHRRWVLDYKQQEEKLSSTGLVEATEDPASAWDLY